MSNPSFPQTCLISRVDFRANVQSSGSAPGRTIPKGFEIHHLCPSMTMKEGGGVCQTTEEGRKKEGGREGGGGRDVVGDREEERRERRSFGQLKLLQKEHSARD